jgi:hypothetical protein
VKMTNAVPLLGKPSRRHVSRVANGAKLLPSTDGRSVTARRFKDLIYDIGADLGGLSELSEAEKQLIRRGALLSAESERQEALWARQHAGERVKGEKFDLEHYSMLVNCQRRIFEVLGLKRRTRDVSLDSYLDAKDFGAPVPPVPPETTEPTG